MRDQAARDRIAGDLDATLFVEAGAGSGKTRSLVRRVVELVAAGVEMREIAAITFTEKAAAELRDRIRTAFETQSNGASLDDTQRTRFRTAVEQVDTAAISTLHAFAQRILTEHPIEAGLPPNVDVLDEVASQIEFADRWARFREQLLDSQDLERCLLLAFAAGIRLDDLRHLATTFDDNWDLVSEPQRLPWERQDPRPCDVERFIARIEGVLARRAECSDDADLLYRHVEDQIAPYLQRLQDAPDEFEQLRLLKSQYPRFGFGYGRQDNWDDKESVKQELAAIGQDKAAHADQVALASLYRVAREVADFTLEAAEQRRTSGRLEFHDLLVLARRLLRGPDGVEVRRALRRRYRRLLLDEFQDTDPIQIDLAVLIACDDPDAARKNWWEIDVEPGRLFFVGDPKQSIYRFRRADIDLFLRARSVFGEPPVQLTTNFRTSPPVIGWVNAVFAQLITDEAGSQPEYQPLDAAPTRQAPPDGMPVVVLGRDEHVDDPNADELRRREAEDVAESVLTALTWQVSERRTDGSETWRPAQLGDVTVLLPARTSLPALERALDARDIPYRAETSSLVYSTREVRDLLMTVRALADPTDQLALVTALRSPVFGCGDDDLFTYKVRYGGALSFRWRPDGVPDDHPVAEALAYLADVHADVAWLSPSELLDRIARGRRLFELGYAQGRPRDLWRRLRFVIDQARAWSEAEGGTLREYVDWARMQASESARVAETILPETDDDSVRIMTIHASKGLEFPIAVVSGMTTQARGRNQRVEVMFPPDGAVALKVGKEVVTPEFEAFQPIDEQMDHHERLRLLYVACTRAKDHLVVSLHRKARRNPQTDPRKCTNAELLAQASQDAPHAVEFTLGGGGALTPPARAWPQPLPTLDEWEVERAQKLSASSVRRSLAATDVGKLVLDAELDEEARAGVEKGPRDLELPPWQKGRYGTAIGRAVHAVLQTIDLATGNGLESAAAAQAAAEGVIGREETIIQLARAALDSEVVKEALGYPRWRETYVAARFDGRTLEGYIDLLFRADDGLVVVDYKTASASADLDRRMAEYRAQGGSYALAVEESVGEPVSRVVFVFLTPNGALERDLADVRASMEAVRAAVFTRTSRDGHGVRRSSRS
ncbi:MAG: UvrD-helicase domain-containing protein [Actinobacteria bacterium]|nr:UvrD-helicase domain-containing protein [Actinomycetota bacterium]